MSILQIPTNHEYHFNKSSPAPVRGAGTGVASFLNRVTGLLAPIIAANIPGDGTTMPIYLSAALIFAAFVGIVLMPIETRGRQRL